MLFRSIPENINPKKTSDCINMENFQNFYEDIVKKKYFMWVKQCKKCQLKGVEEDTIFSGTALRLFTWSHKCTELLPIIKNTVINTSLCIKTRLCAVKSIFHLNNWYMRQALKILTECHGMSFNLSTLFCYHIYKYPFKTRNYRNIIHEEGSKKEYWF